MANDYDLIQIHELEDYSGDLPSSYIAVDNGTTTGKFPASALGAVKVTSSSFSSLPQTITNSKITADMECVKAVLSNPSAQTGDWTVTTSAGNAVVSGSISGSTTLTLYLIAIA